MPEGIVRIIIGFAALLIGWAIGFFDSKMRADKKIKAAEEKAEIAVRQAKGEAERAAAQPAQPAVPGKTLLRLWLDLAEHPNLELDNQPVDTLRISESNRKRLIALLSVMRPWIEGRPAAFAPVSPPLPSTSAPRPGPAAPVMQMPPPVAPSPIIPLAAPAKKEEKLAAPLSIVAQIDEILQARLAFAALADRSIRLLESPDGSVIVLVGSQKFAGINEVTDPEVQSIIRAAIAEWEQKYTPGR